MSDLASLKQIAEHLNLQKGVYNADAWQPFLSTLQKQAGCDRITIRVMGDRFKTRKAIEGNDEHKADIIADINGAYLYRPLLIHEYYGNPKSGNYNAPLGQKSQQETVDVEMGVLRSLLARQSLTIIELRQPNTLEIIYPENEEAKDDLKIKGIEKIATSFSKSNDLRFWAFIPLVYQRSESEIVAVGMITLDWVNNHAKIIDTKQEFTQISVFDSLAKKIHEAFEERKNSAQDAARKTVAGYTSPHQLLSSLTELIREKLSGTPESEYGPRIWDCEAFRQTESADKARHPEDKSEIVRWYPKEEPGQSYQGSTAEKLFNECFEDFRSTDESNKKQHYFSIKNNLVNQTDDFATTRQKSGHLNSLLAVPIVIETRPNPVVIGVFTVNSGRNSAFCYYDYELVREVASLAAPFLERARIQERMQEMSEAARRHNALDDAIIELLKKTCDVVRTAAASVLLLTPNRAESYSPYQHFHYRAGAGVPSQETDKPNPRSRISKQEVTALLDEDVKLVAQIEPFFETVPAQYAEAHVTALRYEDQFLGLIFTWSVKS